MQKIFNLIDKYNLILGQRVFSNLNLFSYNLFNNFYKSFISKKNVPYLKNYIDNGYQNFPKIPDVYIDKLINNLHKQYNKIEIDSDKIKNEGHYVFKLTDEIKSNILDIVNKPMKTLIDNLKQFYNSDIILSNSMIARNYSFNSDDEKYSNFFHNDKYICTLIKVFVNLQDVTMKHGPLRFVKNSNARVVIKENNINVIRINNIKQSDLINHNVGKKGEIFICDTTKLIHAAGIPNENNHRDILFLEFCAYPFKNNFKSINKKNINEIYFPDEYLSKIISKPTGLKNLVKCFFAYI